ncbi:MAG TPA: hypothetical protein VL282_15675, partial [Tepidisphaeraceae bacterium]|nr:hypothetical protein [Tepidisphaeraceae bacterium]
DATGRLKDIANEAEVKRDMADQTEAKGGDVNKIKTAAGKYMDGAKVQKVYSDPNSQGFYIAEVQTKDGEPARITLNDEGQVYSKRWEIKESDIPEPVTKSIEDTFGKDKVKVSKAYRSDFEYYQFDSTTSGGDKVVVRIRPNGDIMSITNSKANEEEEAVTAKAKQGASTPKKKSKTSG